MAGSGVRVNNVEQTTGLIVEWTKGPSTKPPDGLPQYRVAFYTGCRGPEPERCNIEEPQLSYVVRYAYDPATLRGYVYLPGPLEPEYELNTRSILRSVEGNWFPASREWQQFVTRFVSGAR